MNVNQALITLKLKHVPDTPEELREAYKEAASRWHPDRARINGVSEQASSQNMSCVNQANALLRGVMRLRGESRLGRHYSDPMLGQHFPRDEYGYITASSPIDEMVLLVHGVLLGRARHLDVRPGGHTPPTDATDASSAGESEPKKAPTANRRSSLLRKA